MEEKKYSLDELRETLKEKQKIFCHQYIIDWNITRSYKKAYNILDDNSAAVSGHKLLRNTKIQQYIAFIKEDLEKESGITKLKVLNELNKIAFSSISHLHNTWIQLKEFEALTDDQKAGIESIDTKTETRHIDGGEDTEIKWVKIKLYAKGPLLETINKMLGYNAAEKLDIRTPGKEIKLNFDE